jgi:poly(A) polymerase
VQPTLYTTIHHSIDPHLIDKDAITVIRRLKNAGFQAYLVGGSVRDLLLGRTPKDYDISTSAKPEEIKKVFGRQCLLIGRRFRLAHIRFHHKVVEVATFRTGEMTEDLITHDNVWGSEKEDVLRRDFTINGLFYDPEGQTIIDYVGGWQDIESHTLRTIGDPEVRFKQDPVRMLRLLKFQARFGFNVAPATAAAMAANLEEICKSSLARVLEEILRMLESCASAPFFKLMFDCGMAHNLMPALAKEWKQSDLSPLRYLESIDTINQQSAKFPIERAVLAAALIFPLVEKALQDSKTEGAPLPHVGEISHICFQTVRTYLLSAFSHFPKRLSAIMAYVISTQFRLTPQKSKKTHPVRLFQVKEFPLALRFLKVRAMVHNELQPVYIEWRENYRQFLRRHDDSSLTKTRFPYRRRHRS